MPCAVRELAKGVSAPQERHLVWLKRLARFMRHRPRLVQRFAWQDLVTEVETWVDANHARCVRTRKSTSGGVSMLGACCIRAYSKGQSVIALSPGEAEYYGLVSALSQVLGAVSLAKDWGRKRAAHVWMDATAGIAIGSRRGLGKVRHIDTVFLWAQEVVNAGRVSVGKKDTKEMLADMLTKPVVAPSMKYMLDGMGYRFEEGKHALGLKA